MNKRTELLENGKISKVLLSFSLPATIGMLVVALYNIVDTIFVGRGVGPLAIGGLAIVFPIQQIVMALALTIGVGGASVISRNLGAKNMEKANRTFANLITLVLLFGMVAVPLAYFFTDPILVAFGAKGELFAYAKEYFSISLLGVPFISFAMTSNNIIRAEGNSKMAMNVMLIGAAVNVGFDYLFIIRMGYGVSGAAYATVISQITSAITVVIYFMSKKGVLRFKWANMRLDLAIVKETLAIGASSFARQISSSLMSAVLNHGLYRYGGEMAVAVFGVVLRILMLTVMPVLGIVQGFAPIAGYNYGARNMARVKESLRVALRAATVVSLLGFTLMMVFAHGLVGMFTDDTQMINSGVSALRKTSLLFFMVGFQIIGSGLFQALGRAVPALLLSLSRQVLFLIPLVVILPLTWGLNGIWYAFPVSDFLAAAITLGFVLWQVKRLDSTINATTAEHN